MYGKAPIAYTVIHYIHSRLRYSFSYTPLLYGSLYPHYTSLWYWNLSCLGVFESYAVGVPVWLGFVIAPFMVGFYLGPNSIATINITSTETGTSGDNTVDVAIGVFTGLVILCCVGCIKAIHADGKKFKPPPESRFVHFTLNNFIALVRELLDFVQLCGLIFSLQNLPMAWGIQLQHAADNILLTWVIYDVKFWLSFAIFFLWYSSPPPPPPE